jgi:hypothetical protein
MNNLVLRSVRMPFAWLVPIAVDPDAGNIASSGEMKGAAVMPDEKRRLRQNCRGLSRV